jgi:hypothetical protein
LEHYTLGLLNKGQQDMLGIDLVVAVALNNLGGPLSGFLSPFCKAIKSHHEYLPFLAGAINKS